jgi:[ribosomal protein S5]-alanine N-acetyltransferase
MLDKAFTPFPILATQRLTLRPLEITDEQEIFTLRSDSEINKYLDRQKASTIDDARNFIHKITEHIHKKDSLYWAITFTDKNILIGTICLFSFSMEKNSCEIGYELLSNFQGQGIMQEAVEKVIDYAFNTIEVKRMEAFFHRENQRSVNLLKKFSFIDSDQRDENDPDYISYQLTRKQ